MNALLRPEWENFAKRLKWALEQGKREGAVKSGEDWSVKAGRARQYVDTAISRGAGGNILEVASLVDVPGMEFDLYWLATGRGDPRLGRRAQPDAWHERLRGAQIAMEKDGVPYAVVDAVRRDPKWNDEAKFRDKRAPFWRRIFVQADRDRLRLVPAESSAPPASDRKRDAG